MEKNMSLPTKDELEMMAAVDIKTVEPESLTDIADVVIDQELPVKERIKEYFKQIKNPYLYNCNGVTVKIGFSGKTDLNTCLQNALLKI